MSTLPAMPPELYPAYPRLDPSFVLCTSTCTGRRCRGTHPAPVEPRRGVAALMGGRR